MSALVARQDAKSGDAGRVGAVVSYAMDPSKKNEHERLICSGQGNLFETGSVGITKEMRGIADAAKALDSRVSIDPFEHLVISFEEGDSCTEADCKRSVAIALKHLGLEDCPYVYGMHDDTGNRHIHLAALRINPNTLKALSVPFVVKQCEQIGALINAEFGMAPMIKNRYTVDELGNVQKVATTKIKEPNKLAEIIKDAKTWAEFHARTRAIGINFDKKGSGALINGEKASDIDRGASMAKLVKRWGEFVPAIDAIARPYMAPPHVSRAKDRKAARVELSDAQRAARDATFQEFKAKKSELWQKPPLPYVARIALSSFIAKDYATAMAELRDKHKVERRELSTELNQTKPRLAKVEIANTITGDVVLDVPPKDIRAYVAYVDEADKRRVIYSTSENGKADFIDHGKNISIVNLADDSLLAALQLGQAKFGARLTINGNDEFKLKAMKIAVANNIAVSNPELQAEYAAEKYRLEKERLSIMKSKYPAMDEFKRLADAVPADRWRVTLGSYIEVIGRDGKPFNPTTVLRDDKAPPLTNSGMGAGMDGLSVDQVCEKWGYLEHCQGDLKKARVILTPASDSLHIIHIDDVKPEALERLKADGFAPCAIIGTSPGKHSVILTAKKDLSLTEKESYELAKRLSQQLNKDYGDPLARNATQPFRSPGFGNLKPQYKADDGSYPLITLKHAQRGDCAKLGQVLQEMTDELKAVKVAPVVIVQAGKVSAFIPQGKGQETEAYFAHVKAIRAAADAGKMTVRTRKNGTLDQSSIDALAAQRMRMTGWNRAQIVQGVAAGCNDVRAFHGDKDKYNPLQYAELTADVAMKINLAQFDHQIKYRLFDEKQANVLSPVVALENKRLEAIKQAETQARYDAMVKAERLKSRKSTDMEI